MNSGNAELARRLGDEADQCRNDGVEDIAELLDEARIALGGATVAPEPLWLTDDDLRRIAKKVGMVASHDGVTMRSVGHAGGMTAEDGFAFARAAIAAVHAAEPGPRLCAVCGRPPHAIDDSECMPATKPIVEKLAWALQQIVLLRIDADRYRFWRAHWRTQFALDGRNPGNVVFKPGAPAPVQLVGPDAINAALDVARAAAEAGAPC